MLTHSIIVEVDENQHKNNRYICDNKRMMELFVDLGNRPIVFIKFNPDKYKSNNIKYESCFDIHSVLEVPYVKDKKQWKSRLMSLKKKIKTHMENIPDKEVTEDYLFYDD